MVLVLGLLTLPTTWIQFVVRWLFRRNGRGFVGGAVEYIVDNEAIHLQVPLAFGRSDGVAVLSAVQCLRMKFVE
jgi:hypothetical protein